MMPPIGLGTWKLRGEECESVVRLAIELGYRHIDTADLYENHREVGRGIKSIHREELFLVSKLAGDELLPARIKTAVLRLLKELDTPYLDLLLIHGPNPEIPSWTTLEAMMECRKAGLVREIGVSNFMCSHLEEIAPYKFPIFTNQIELHPHLPQKEIVATGIPITAYSPLARGALKNDPLLKKIGEKHGKSASQVALRWIVQQGFAAIPKASSRAHLLENLAIFDFTLNAADMQMILP